MHEKSHNKKTKQKHLLLDWHDIPSVAIEFVVTEKFLYFSTKIESTYLARLAAREFW